MIQEPTLLGQAATITDQAPVLPHYPMARDQDGEMVRRDQPSDLPRMESGRSGNIVVGPGFSQRNPPEGLEDRDLSGG